MNFTHYSLGVLDKGRIVEVHLKGNAANVYLMDTQNFANYKKGGQFRALGGLMNSSPVRLQAIEAAHWFIVVDLPNGFGQVKTSYRILSGKVRPTHSQPLTFRVSKVQKQAASALSPPPSAEPTESLPLTPATPSIPIVEGAFCRKCGLPHITGKFCTECGTAIENKCAACSTINPASAKFCLECGSALI